MQQVQCGIRGIEDETAKMTFPRWRGYSYKHLESKQKRRNTIAAIRSPRRQTLAFVASQSPEREITQDVDLPTAAAAHAEIEKECQNGTATNGHLPPQAETELPSVPPQHRTRGWTASLRSRLSWRRRPSGSRQLRSTASPAPDEEREVASMESEPVEVPLTDAELEALLQEAWGSVLAVGEVSYTGFLRKKQALEYSRKMDELRHQYKLKTAEILQREATFVRLLLSHDESTPLLQADQFSVPAELERVLSEAKSSGKFDKLRLELKKETAVAILALKSRYPTVVARQKQRSGEKLRPRPHSCQWPSRTLVYSNPQHIHSDAVVQSGSMVGICNGFYATENLRCIEPDRNCKAQEPRLENSL